MSVGDKCSGGKSKGRRRNVEWEELQFEIGWSGEASLGRTHLNGGLKEVSHAGV